MNLLLLTVGKTDVAWVKEGLELYRDRLQHYVRFSITEIPQLKNASSLTQEQIKEKEADAIERCLESGDRLILLDERGRMYRSMEWASWLEKQLSGSARRLVFLIGGAYGFSRRIYDRAQDMVSLSPMTFSHQMVRTVFAEQLYRAFTIMKGEPYHHE